MPPSKTRVWLTRICQQCGKEYQVSEYDIKRGRGKYCSHNCNNLALKGRPKNIVRIEKVKCICLTCGKEFQRMPLEIEKGGGKFCSIDCYHASRVGVSRSNETRARISHSKMGHTVGEAQREKQRMAMLGRQVPWEGVPKSEQQKQKQHEAMVGRHDGENNPFFGRIHSEETRQKLSEQASQRVGDKNHQWKGGISFLPYCPKFNERFRKRVRDFFDNTCMLCGHKWIVGEPKLSVHHVNYRKDSCCDPGVPRLFVPLCQRCHSKTSGDYITRALYEKHFTDLIMTKYGGKCYVDL